MAQKTVVHLVDDLDGSVAARTHRIVVDGRAYDIDMSEDNYVRFAQALDPYLRAGRRVGVGRGGVSAAERREQSARMRRWAADNGYVVAAHGRVPAAVRAAFYRSQPVAV